MHTSALLSIFTIAAAAINQNPQGISGRPINQLPQGFHGEFYDYPPQNGRQGLQPPFMPKPHGQGQQPQGQGQPPLQGLGSANGINQVNFNYPNKPGKVPVYGVNVDPTHFAVELTGWYRPKQSGVHTFKLNKVHDGASFQFGILDKSHSLRAVNDVISPDFILSSSNVQDAKLHLDTGKYYPMRLFYFNNQGESNLDFSIILPDGSIDQGSFTNIYQIDEEYFSVSATASGSATAAPSTTATNEASVASTTNAASATTSA